MNAEMAATFVTQMPIASTSMAPITVHARKVFWETVRYVQICFFLRKNNNKKFNEIKLARNSLSTADLFAFVL